MDKLFEKLEKLKQLSDPTLSKIVRQPSQSQTGVDGTPSKSGDNRHRMTEKEEDEELMNETSELEKEDELITRFDASPGCNSMFCCYCQFLNEINCACV